MTKPATLDYSTAQGTIKAAEAIDRRLQGVMDASNPWSKPGRKFNAWWTPEIGQLKEVLASTRRAQRADKGSLALRVKENEAAT